MEKRVLIFFVGFFFLLVILGGVFAQGAVSNLQGHWKFDENTGIVVQDSSENGNMGAIYGATWTVGKLNSALDFDGINDRVVIENNQSLDITGNKITLMAWVYPHNGGNGGGSRVISKRTDRKGDDVYSMFTYQNKFRFRLDGSSDLISTNYLKVYEWQHVAMVYDGSVMKIYIDGVLDPSTQIRSSNVKSSGRPVHIGMREGEKRHFNGVIDDVRVYDRDLNQEEIIEEM